MNMIELLKAVVLGMTEGFTEWLPVSAAAHLMLMEGILRPEADAAVLELLSRSTSFYCCVILCFIVVAVSFFIGKRRSAGDI